MSAELRVLKEFVSLIRQRVSGGLCQRQTQMKGPAFGTPKLFARWAVPEGPQRGRGEDGGAASGEAARWSGGPDFYF